MMCGVDMVNKPSVLICGERFGRVRDAFRRAGADAWSCDLQASETPGAHYRENWRDVIPRRSWDFILIHFVCTAVCVSGNHKYARGKPGWPERVAACAAIDSDMVAVKAHARFWCVENPVSVIPTMTQLGPKRQEIHPHQFGHDASKTTWLWHNLPLLVPTKHVDPRWVCCGKTLAPEVGKYGCPNCHGERKPLPRWANQTDSGQNRLAPDRPGNEGQRAAERGATYEGWADAMAAQWLPVIRS